MAEITGNQMRTRPNNFRKFDGAVTVLDTPFNTTDGEGQLWEVYPWSRKNNEAFWC